MERISGEQHELIGRVMSLVFPADTAQRIEATIIMKDAFPEYQDTDAHSVPSSSPIDTLSEAGGPAGWVGRAAGWPAGGSLFRVTLFSSLTP